jgi:hypothetical protein
MAKRRRQGNTMAKRRRQGNTMAKRKQTNNDLQNTTLNTKVLATRTPFNGRPLSGIPRE